MIVGIQYQNDNDENIYLFNSFEEIKNYNKVVCINCYGSKLSVLPKLPNSLKKLNCDCNKFIKLIKYKYLIWKF